MQFETRTRLSPNLFYALQLENNKPHYFFPLRYLEPQPVLVSQPYSLAENLCTNFAIRAVSQGQESDSPTDIIGFLFKSNLPVANYRTSIMSYSKSWQQNAAKVEVTSDDLTLTLKDENFLVFHAPGKATLVTGLTLSDKLHEFLTMI